MVDLYSFISMHRHNPNSTREHELSPIVNYISKFRKLRIYVHCKSIGRVLLQILFMSLQNLCDF
jgi:hypothetical protein